MSFLELLPREISTEILSYLPQSDLVNTCILSRYIHAVCQPLLFKNPDLTKEGYYTTSAVRNLLRTLLSPGGERLATLVRSIHVEWGGYGRARGWARLANDNNPERTAQNDRDMTVIAAAATSFGLLPNRSPPVAQLLLLLHHLPCLHTLRITAYDDRGSAFSSFAPNHNVRMDDPPLGLPQLSGLQQLRRIDVRISGQSTIDLDTFDVDPTFSVLPELRTPRTIMSRQSLEFILGIPAAPEYFSYSSEINHLAFDLAPALQRLQMSLIHLRLQFVEVTQPIGSLRDWPALKTVRCSLAVLLGKEPQEGSLNPTGVMQKATATLADVLPPGLRELEIYPEGYWSVAAEVTQAVELLRQKETAVPVLETLVVALSTTTREVRYQRELKIACLDARVVLVDGARKGKDKFQAWYQ